MTDNIKTLIGFYSTSTIHDYITLCKPKIILMLLITAVVGMHLANPNYLDIKLFLLATTGIGLAASSAAVFNHIIDAQIDQKMARTQKRPMADARISRQNALIFAITLCALSMMTLLIYVNALTAIITLLGTVGYAFIYTIYLKHSTPQNIVYGGIAGALPPLLGWTSVTNSIDLEPLLLVLLIFVWTPAHFWPLAIHRINDYKKADIPMLPVIKGIVYTKRAIVVYATLTLLVSILPFTLGFVSTFYLITALLLGSWFIYFTVKLQQAKSSSLAMPTFYVSIYYLIGIFIALFIDKLI
ncbi:MAG: protoheme IX farnesyltransferase [Psychroserpens sp.]|jgi:protoheme IX farnesyltransferase